MTNDENTPVPPAGALSGGKDVTAELDRLNAACLAAPGEIGPQVELWRAVVALDTWFFINRGDDTPRPFAVADQAGNMVCVYSSPQRAQEAARAVGLVTGDAPAQLIGVPVPAAVDWVVSLGDHGVVGATLDHPQVGAWTPVANLPRLRQEIWPTS